MKIFNKIAIAMVSLGVLFSCETIELDLTDSPNSLTPDQADPNFLLNNTQEDFARFIQGFGGTGAQLTRINYMFGRNYDQVYSPQGFDGQWRTAYSTILADLYTMYPLAEEGGLMRHMAMGQFMEAFIMVTLVDFFGDVPYSEALQGADNFNPSVDPGASIYDAALALLDDAVNNFTRADNSAEPDIDLYYNGDWDNWVKAANSLMIKIYAQRRLVDPGAAASINAIVSGGDYIDESSEDFQFQWGTNLTNPDTRHPSYGGNYINTGAANYMSNWLMGYMQSDKVGNSEGTFEDADPRIRYYFYRQFDCTPGNGCEINQQELSCSVEPAPAHYVAGNFSFCNLPDGYWGRDHGDDDGIPPDGLKRTVFGVYPIGGRFDDSTFEPVDQGQGAGGGGITPIILSSSMDFLLAELDLVVNGDPTAARDHMLEGIQKSFTKVRSFGDLDTGADLSFAADVTDDADYIQEVSDLFDNAADDNERLNILAKEFWVALYGNGIDAYNFYRRTGAPFDLQPNLEPDPGIFIRSNFYPAVFANTNSSVDQKADTAQPVFWDTNASAPTAN